MLILGAAVAFAYQLMISTAQFYAPYDAEDCPMRSTKISLGRCIELHPDPLRPERAQSNCKVSGGTLLNLMVDKQVDQRTVDYVSSLLNEIYNDGYHEEAWLASSTEPGTSKGIEYDLPVPSNSIPRYVVLRRLINRTYSVEPVSSLQTIYPYVCMLDAFTKRKLLYQQSLLPTGAPQMVVHPNSEYHYVKKGVNVYLSLPCVATGKPFPQIRWFKSGVEEVQLSSGRSSFLLSGGSLLLPLETENDSSELVQASYHCTAENSLGIVRSTVAVVRPAFIAAFPEKRLDVYSINYPHSGARIECQAPAHYPRSHSYSWLINGTTDRFISQNDRIFISRDGTLFFSYNIKEDETSYACSVELPSTQSGIYGPFFNLRLPQHVSEEEFPPHIDSFQPQIFPEMPQTGRTAFLECFAYARPSPTYRWSRIDGKPLSRKAALTSNGRVLRIDQLEVDDEGAYRCTALNELGSDSAVVKLNVYVKPRILTPLYDRMLSTNATAMLDCFLANGSTTVEWFRNASPLNALLLSADDRARITVQKNRLIIASTRAEDSAVYQCIATNEIGSASSSARLTIIDFKPRFDSFTMPKKVSAVPGMRLVIPCIYEASPVGFAAWFRHGGEPIHSYGRVRQQGGSLVHKLIFQSVESGDEGEYVCAVANRCGETQYSVQLTVLEKPNVIVLPKIKLLSTYAGNVSVICEVETSCKSTDDCTEAQFDWSLNDQPLRSLPFYKHIRSIVTENLEKRGKRFLSKVKQKYELELPSTLGLYRFGRFACTSLYGGGASELESQPVPPSPVNVRVANITADSVELSWKQPLSMVREQRHSQPKIDAYKIEMRTKKDRSWRSVRIVTLPQGNSLVPYRIDHLQPNEEYQFRVKARSGKEFGHPSKSTSWLKTLASAPLEPINQIWWRKLNSHQILVQWDPGDLNQRSGSNLRYLLSWCFTSTNNTKYTVTVRTDSYVVQLNRSMECEAMHISVIPINDIGTGAIGPETVAYISDERPARYADHIEGRVINSTCAKFQWKWKGLTECENFYGTKISCTDDINETISQSFGTNKTHWLFNGLHPSATYHCQIIAFDHYGRYGPSIETVIIQTKQAAPACAPRIREHWIHKTQKDYSVSLHWTPVFDQQATENRTELLGYKIWLHVSETATRPTVLWIAESDLQDQNSPSAEIDGLKLMYQYTFRVSGFNDGGDGPLSEPYTVRIRRQDVLEEAVFRPVEKGAPWLTAPASLPHHHYLFILLFIVITRQF